MKRFIVFSWCTIFSGMVICQIQLENRVKFKSGKASFTGYGKYMYYKPLDTNMAANGITGMLQCHYYHKKSGKKSKSTSCQQQNYDSLGRVTEEWRLNSKGEAFGHRVYQYDSKNHVSNLSIGDKPQKLTILKYQFNDSGKLVFYSMTYKEKLREMSRYTYGNQTKLTRLESFKKDSTKIESVLSSAYDPETGKQLRSELRDKKGKLKYSWDYSCDPKGELSKTAEKKETRTCKSDVKLANGHRQTIYELHEGGELKRYIYEEDSANRIVLYLEYAGKSGEILKSKSKTSYSETGSENVNTIWTKNGIISAEYIYKRNSNRQNLVSLSNYYNAKGKKTASWQTVYTYGGTGLLARTSGMSLLKPDGESITEYQYFQ